MPRFGKFKYDWTGSTERMGIFFNEQYQYRKIWFGNIVSFRFNQPKFDIAHTYGEIGSLLASI